MFSLLRWHKLTCNAIVLMWFFCACSWLTSIYGLKDQHVFHMWRSPFNIGIHWLWCTAAHTHRIDALVHTPIYAVCITKLCCRRSKRSMQKSAYRVGNLILILWHTNDGFANCSMKPFSIRARIQCNTTKYECGRMLHYITHYIKYIKNLHISRCITEFLFIKKLLRCPTKKHSISRFVHVFNFLHWNFWALLN